MRKACHFAWYATFSGVMALLTLSNALHAAETKLADQPIRATIAAPANVLLTPSVEYPTAISVAHIGDYDLAKRYDGYFDPNKCYNYVSADPDLAGSGYFKPVGFVSSGYACSGQWSGNFMNWATMQGIDLFRWALTGGRRDVDKPSTFSDASAGRSVVIRAYSSFQGNDNNFPQRDVSASLLATVAGAPVDTSVDLKIINRTMGTKVRFRKTVVTVTYDKKGNPQYSSTTEDTDLDVRVEVCVDSSVSGRSLLEANCKLYRDPNSNRYVYRPEGLMQDNANSMRFGTFGYLVNSNIQIGGGVLRGRMTNVSAELTDSGAFLSNPAPADATASGVTQSGVMNYLNKFGVAAKLYKTYDPVSELYAEGLRYLKGYSEPTTGYTTIGSAGEKDDFPVISQWDDPILYACQKNFILGIGDVNTHADRNLAGGATGGNEPSTFPANLDDKWGGSNVRSWTKSVGDLEGTLYGYGGGSNVTANRTFTNLGDATDYPRCCSSNGAFIAGAAYFAHTQDIRPGSGVGGVENPNEIGKQTVTTFWVDVLEYQVFYPKNQFWLAAKYGGFVDENENGTFDAGVDSWNAKGRTYEYYERNSGGAIVDSSKTYTADLPDNYFPASQGSEMVDGLRSAFDQINNLIASGAGVGLASSSISTSITESSVYGVSFDSDGWAGSVKGYRITDIDTDSGVLTLSEKWDAAKELDKQDWNSGRKIVTSKWTVDADGKPVFDSAIPFRWAQFSAAEQTAYFNSDQSMLQFLRGRRDKETTDDAYNAFRKRKAVLGDVVNSEAVYVGKPSAEYSDAFNPGYAAFKTSHADRDEMIYVGANDGMLHAFYADTSGSPTSKGGKELWAYIPGFLLLGPDGNPEKSGLWALSKNDFVHRNYVDATPIVRDIDFAQTHGEISVAAEGSTATDWRTVLVGGLGKGGRGFYAIDITDPDDMTGESAVAAKVLWEFTDADMGYSYGRPLVTKTRKWGWVVMLTGGYNNVEATIGVDGTDNRGKGVLYILDAKTGALLQKILTTEGTATNPAGFAQVTGYTLSYADYTTEQVYGGDLLGNIWRFDVSDSALNVPTPVKLATLKDASGNVQPITTAPQVEYGAGDPQFRRWVFVGTGRQLDATDSPSSAQQTFYALRDGTRSTPYASADLPTGVTFPVARGDMTELGYDDLIKGGVNVASGKMGWFIDLTGRDDAGDSDSASERVVINPVANDGVISWVGSIPSTDPCTPTGTARVYAVKYATGASVLYTYDKDMNRNTEPYMESLKGLVKAQPVRQGNSIRILGTDPTGNPSLIGPGIGEPSDPRVVNWRFIN